MNKFVLPAIAALTLGSAAQAATITTLATSSIYGAGISGSIAAQEFALGSYTSGSAVVLSDVFGEVDCCDSTASWSTFSAWTVGADGGDFDDAPDGRTWGGDTDVNGTNGLSGIAAPSQLFLAGVFVSSTVVPLAPSELVYGAGDLSLTSYAPELNQVFFLGDGLTGTGAGAQQMFYIPDWADTLLIGFVDAPEFEGDPYYYADNSGSITATFDVIAPAVPLPAGLPLMLSAFGLAGFVARRRKS